MNLENGVHDAPAAYEMMTPYGATIVGMEDGCRVTFQIIEVDRETVKIGMPVEATFRKLGSEGDEGVIRYGYNFRPVM